MEQPPRLVRFTYWFGAVVDGAMVVPLLFPTVASAMLGLDRSTLGPEYRYAAYLAAALMTGWTALLVWGVNEPVARRTVLLLTVLPSVAGLIAACAYAVTSGLVRAGYMVPVFVVQVVICTLFLGAYHQARGLAGVARPEQSRS
ncbi:MAG: hypothetical protein HYR62_05475 [Actinobacteria bacterium]|nr:hypothetical protein [Actinomycetota bacterium]MBI3688492.1 hypothetical protein [Actinomycetota bacterium]